MFLSKTKIYTKLPESSVVEQDRLDMEILGHTYQQRRWSSQMKYWERLSFIGSLAANALLVFLLYVAWTQPNMEDSKYAGLTFDLILPYYQETPYHSHNMTAADEIWEALEIGPGVVALTDAYVAEMQLPLAQRFPWDQSKGVYALGAYHSLHCVKSIHQAIYDLYNNLTLRRPIEHINHCVEALRQDIICHADDTPMFTSASPVPDTGLGQNRVCRDFSKLQAWARERSACFEFIEENNMDYPNIERYKYCPEGSPYRSNYEKKAEIKE